MSTRRIDTAIGGVSEERTERGFAIYGRVVDDHGNTVRVQRSSACGEAHCHVFTRNAEGRDHEVGVVGAPNGVLAATPHLNRAQARELAWALLRFADEVTP